MYKPVGGACSLFQLFYRMQMEKENFTIFFHVITDIPKDELALGLSCVFVPAPLSLFLQFKEFPLFC